MGYDCGKVKSAEYYGSQDLGRNGGFSRRDKEEGSGISFFFAMVLGSFLSSLTWCGFTYGPQTVSSVSEWWNAPPKLSSVGEKISEMLDNKDAWTFNGNSGITAKTAKGDLLNVSVGGTKAYFTFNKMDKGYMLENGLNTFFSEREASYLAGKAKVIMDDLKEKDLAKKAAAVIEKLN